MHQLNSKNNGPVLLFKTIFRHGNCFMKAVACDQALHSGDIVKSTRARVTLFAARSRVPPRLASLAQIGELARRLCRLLQQMARVKMDWNSFNVMPAKITIRIMMVSGPRWNLFYIFFITLLASPQTSFGVRSSRNHFSLRWGRNECVTNEPQRTSAGRL